MTRVSAILLAAGLSERMGTPKPLLPWLSATLLEYQIGQLAAAGVTEIIVVLGHRAEEILPHAKHPLARVAINRGYREGRASSLRAGAAEVDHRAEAIVILSVDQPRPAGITAVLTEKQLASGGLITAPTFSGQRGHPVVLAGSLLPELAAATEETQGLRALMRKYGGQTTEVSFDSSVVLLDLNTPADYAKEFFLSGNSSGSD